ncbi:MAG: peptidoglycan-binding domain-containing protein [Cocleimonas sp.]
MKMTTKLSVSSVILASVLSGCSQQQVMGGSQVAGGSQYAPSSQQQIEGSTAAVQPQQPRVTPPPVSVYKKRVVKQRVYTRGPKPRPTRSIQRRSSGLPAAHPGQCFAKVKVAEKYITKSKRVLIQKATSKRVLSRAPQYRWVNKNVLVRKATQRKRVIPAQYRTTVKRVMVKPAYNTWRKGHGAITRIDNMTGEIMCRVKVPAVYKNVTSRVLVRSAKTINNFVPAVYKTVKQKRMIAPAQYRTVNTPARYKTQNYRVKVGGSRYVWRSILCQTNAPKNYRRAVVKQKAMAKARTTNKYRKPHGITQAQYLKVMNAMPVKRKTVNKAVSVPKKAKVTKPQMPDLSAMEKVKKVTKPQIPDLAAMEKVKKQTPEPVAKKDAKEKKADKPTKTTMKKNIVFGIQAALKSKGYNPGKVDGKMGPNTAAALKAFQSSRGLPVGVLSKDTFRALGLVR